MMHESTEKPIRHEVTPQQGLGYYPISDMQYDVLNLIARKSKALKLYDLYLRDSKPDPELSAVLEQIRTDDRKHIEQLMRFVRF